MRTTLLLRKTTRVEFDEDFGLGDLEIIEDGGLATIRLVVLDDDALLTLASACSQLHEHRAMARIDARRCSHVECHDSDGHTEGCLVDAREAVQS